MGECRAPALRSSVTPHHTLMYSLIEFVINTPKKILAAKEMPTTPPNEAATEAITVTFNPKLEKFGSDSGYNFVQQIQVPSG
jgi:hypothetical protein